MSPSVDILLATYNGARYLPEMLASLDAQTGIDFRILVRDDGSTDGTRDILAAWAARQPQRVRLLPVDAPTGSASGNFGRLMLASTADYVLFADQDDIWLPTKVAATVDAIRAAERDLGEAGRPAMAFCDLKLVDGEGRTQQESFRRFLGLDLPADVRFERLLLHNVVTGCAMGVNRAALEACGQVPAEAVMHDWWLALLCSGLGTIRTMPECLIDYRQHDGNVVGVKPSNPMARLPGFRRLSAIHANIRAYRRWLQGLYRQAALFRGRHGDRLAPRDRVMLDAFCGLADQGPVARRLTVLRHGFRLKTIFQTMGFLARM